MTIIPGNAAKVNIDYSEPKPKAKPPKAKANKPKWKPWLWLNKNFGNYPLARDPKTRMHWRECKKTDQLIATLPRENLIQLILPADAPDDVKHAPSGFDMAVLFQLMAEVQRTGMATINLSCAELVHRMELEDRSRNRQAVRAALKYWFWIGLLYKVQETRARKRGWHEDGKHVRKLWQPPIAAVKGGRITLDPEWVALVLPGKHRKRGYVEQILAVMPLEASEQNYHLMLLVSAIKRPTDDGVDIYYQRNQSSFAGKTGLSTKNRRPRLQRVSEKVEAWWFAHGGVLVAVIGPNPNRKIRAGRIGFAGIKPPARRGGRSVGPSYETRDDVELLRNSSSSP